MESTTNGTGPRMAESSVSGSVVSTVLSFAFATSTPIETLEEATGQSRFRLVDPTSRLPDDTHNKIWLAMSQANPGAALTLEMARAAPLSYMSGIAEAAQFAPTLRHALLFIAENRVLLNERWQLDLDEGLTTAAWTVGHPNDALDGGLVNETSVAMSWRLLRDLPEKAGALTHVRFANPSHGPLSAYEEYFAAPVSFEAASGGSTLLFPKSDLDATNRHANPQMFQLLRELFARRRAQLEGGRPDPQITRLKQAIADNAATGDFRSSSAARAIGKSLRSAQRLVALHGTSLHGLIEDRREQIAKEAMIEDPESSVEAIAWRLGYSDDRAFRRAFKRWTGKTPSEFRSMLHA